MPRKDPHIDAVNRSGITPYMNAFLEHGKVSGISNDTTRRRHSALKRFIAWCDDRGLETPQDITKPILERYQRYLFHYRKADGKPLSYGSQNTLLTPIKTFFKYLSRDNHILYNPASELTIPKKPRRLPKSILTLEEVKQVFNLPDIKTVSGIRDRAVLEMLYSTGIRRAELVNLDMGDIDAKRGTVLVREGKGRKDRVIPVGEHALQWCEHYRLEIRYQLVIDPKETALFVSNTGERFTRSNLARRVKEYLNRAGIDKEGSCHLFRHAMATHMLENGADIRYIQAMLGHADLNTTQIYTQVSIEKLKAIHRATHPADRTEQT